MTETNVWSLHQFCGRVVKTNWSPAVNCLLRQYSLQPTFYWKAKCMCGNIPSVVLYQTLMRALHLKFISCNGLPEISEKSRCWWALPCIGCSLFEYLMCTLSSLSMYNCLCPPISKHFDLPVMDYFGTKFSCSASNYDLSHSTKS